MSKCLLREDMRKKEYTNMYTLILSINYSVFEIQLYDVDFKMATV